jgi:hypothetical protein
LRTGPVLNRVREGAATLLWFWHGAGTAPLTAGRAKLCHHTEEDHVNVDVADGLLLDVRDMDITDLRFDGESGLDKALERILASNGECNFNSFGSSI